jgi:Velvet factor.
MGTLVASPFVGLDDKGEEGCFFCFPDLSCRTPGTFRLKFALVMIDPTRMHVGHRSAIVATVMSEPFQVFNAKDFPGMQASTPLTKRLKEQGCLISIKKGNEKRDGKNGSGGDSASGGKGPNKREEDDDDDDDEGSGCEERATKRLKR